MLKPYELLESVLSQIEKNIRNNINAIILAKKYSISEGHLRRIFKFAFKQSIASYIRSRKLAASLDDLLKTELNILDIALDFGFDYEQSYIRAFKREFGLSPGELRKRRKIVKINPPLNLFRENKLTNGVIFGPDIVMVPKFYIVGKRHSIPFSDSITMAPEMAKQFWEKERILINEQVNPKVYIGLTRNLNIEKANSDYLPSVQVSNLKNIPPGFVGDKFDDTFCARFRYIGQHHYLEINRNRAREMYDTIWKNVKFRNDIVFFERIDTGLYDGNYCQMEWFTPVNLEKK
ncbi:MAG: helix-turn-helix domain-containing protein [Firmicutes bacterium]|nr:helix-turn-helix domain-containing protein [Bacillota bacterium]